MLRMLQPAGNLSLLDIPLDGSLDGTAVGIMFFVFILTLSVWSGERWAALSKASLSVANSATRMVLDRRRVRRSRLPSRRNDEA